VIKAMEDGLLMRLEHESPIRRHVLMFMIAGAVQMFDLQALALRKIEDQLQKGWDARELADCILKVYDAGEEGHLVLKRILVDAVREYCQRGASILTFAAVFPSHPEFLVEVLRSRPSLPAAGRTDQNTE
jgi:hypothetical protein